MSYANIRSVQIRMRAPGMGVVSVDLPRAAAADSAAAAPQPPARRPGGGAKENFDLSSFYSNDGALADSDNNLIPDRVDVLAQRRGRRRGRGRRSRARGWGWSRPASRFRSRRRAKTITAPDGEPILVLVGTSHPIVDQLVRDKKWEAPQLQPGEGLIQLVKKAFGEKSALIVTGGDAAGVARAVQQLAETFPHIWQRGKDRHDARRCRGRCAEVRRRALARGAGGDGPVQAARSSAIS